MIVRDVPLSQLAIGDRIRSITVGNMGTIIGIDTSNRTLLIGWGERDMSLAVPGFPWTGYPDFTKVTHHLCGFIYIGPVFIATLNAPRS